MQHTPDPRSANLVTWELARSLDALAARMTFGLAELADLIRQWQEANPVAYEPVFSDGRYTGLYLLTESPDIPTHFAARAAEILRAARGIHEHINKAHRAALVLPDPWPPQDEWWTKDLADADNYAKHQALPLSYLAFMDPALLVFDVTGRTHEIPVTAAPPAVQAGDPVLWFGGPRFDEVMSGNVSHVAVRSEVTVAFGPPLFAEHRRPMIDMLAFYASRAIAMVEPILEWLERNPDRPVEARSFRDPLRNAE